MTNFILLFILIIQANNFLPPKRNLQESSDDIIILHLNDVHCGVNQTIGYDGFVLYRNELNKRYENIITVDVGDHAQGGTLGSISDGSAIIKIMNKIGFDVQILGNHEFDYGVDQLKKLNENIINKYISCNFCYKANKSAIFKPYKIIEKAGKKIAFIGIVTPLTFSKTFLSTIRDSNGNAIYDFLSENGGQELIDRVKQQITEVKNKGADYVILLTHLGMTIEQYTSDGLLSQLDNVDAILDGHTHLIYNTTSKDKNGKEVHISQTGTKLQSIGKLIIKSNGDIKSEIIEEIPEPNDEDKESALNLTNRGWVDKDMNNFLNDLWEEYEDQLNIVYGHSDYTLVIRPEGTSDSHFIYCRYIECTVGNLVADSFKYAGNANASIVNGGSIRSNLNKGDLTRANLIEVVPFFNDIITKIVSGQDILDALEFGTRNYPKTAGGFPQVGGISYDIDTSINSSVLADKDGLFLSVPGKRRVSNVKINGEDLALDKNYSVAMSTYIAAGGDGYTMFNKYDIFNESLLTDSDAIADYIVSELNKEIPEKYNKLQGRINLVNGSVSSSTTEIKKLIEKKNSNGLSTGGIIAIIIPSVLLLLAAVAIAFMCSKNGAIAQPISMNSDNVLGSNSNILPNK